MDESAAKQLLIFICELVEDGGGIRRDAMGNRVLKGTLPRFIFGDLYVEACKVLGREVMEDAR